MLRFLLPLMLLAAPASAGTYAEVKGWTITPVDSKNGDWCMALALYEGGNGVAFSADAFSKNRTYVFTNDKWRSLKTKKDVPVEVQFVWKERITDTFNVDATATDNGFLFVLENDDFAAAWSVAHQVIINNRSNGKQIVNLNLDGTYAAGLKALECSRFRRASREETTTEDPFAATT